MGAKAKEAIKAGESAIAGMRTNANDMVAAYQGMYAQKKNTAAFRGDLINFAAAKFPGKNDLTADVMSGSPAGQELKRLFEGITKSKAQTQVYRESVKAGSLLLKQNIDRARAAIVALDKLIIAKAAKKDAAGSNPLKKIGAAIQTKSLGNLRDQKRAIDTAIAEVNAMTIAIVDYAERKLKKAG
jgi:hypothetical protein